MLGVYKNQGHFQQIWMNSIPEIFIWAGIGTLFLLNVFHKVFKVWIYSRNGWISVKNTLIKYL